MPYIEFGCLPTVIGSMPHTDPSAACSQVIHYLKDIPAWSQLPKRSFLENMYVQFSHGFPGVVVKEDSIYIDRSQDLDKPLEQLYAAYLENDIDKYPISPEYAAGLHHFLSLTTLSPLAVKGQIIGPISWGLTVTDDSRLFVDEPSMVSFGSAFVSLSREKVISLLEEVFGGISRLKGVHCCGNTDWSVLLDTSADILSFDAYNYAQSLSLYPSEVKKFLERGSTIAWGIIPNDEESLANESVASLKDRLEEAMAPFTRKGIRFKQLIEQGLLTPSCGLAALATEEASARVLELLAELSAKIRRRYI